MTSQYKVLLINSPREPLNHRYDFQKDIRLPLGIMYLAAFLKKKGVSVHCTDMDAEAWDDARFKKYFAANLFDCIGLNCYTANHRIVFDIIAKIKSLQPNSLIVLGGPHPALAPVQTLKECPGADVTVIGEGEVPLWNILRFRKNLGRVPNIAYRKGTMICTSKVQNRRLNLDSLPFPDHDDIQVDRYLSYKDPVLGNFWERAYISASRGCSHTCIFCASQRLWNNSVQWRTAATVVTEIKWYLKTFGIRRFYFYDDSFPEWPDLSSFCQKAKALKIEWSCQSCIDRINNDSITMMAECGCKEIAFGIESGAASTLKRIEKPWTKHLSKKDLIRLIEWCGKHDIITRAHFMIGFPWETKNDIAQTVKFALTLREHSLRDANFFIAQCYPGTRLDRNFRRVYHGKPQLEQLYEIIHLDDWRSTKNEKVAAKLRRFNTVPAISLNPLLNSRDLRQAQKNAFELFFGDGEAESVKKLLWKGIN